MQKRMITGFICLFAIIMLEGVAFYSQSAAAEKQISISLKTHKGFYLVAEKGGGGAVNANRKKAREWETFTLIDLNGGHLYPRDKIHLKTYNGKHYVVAEGGGGGVVRADSTIPRELETFVIDEYIFPQAHTGR